MRSHHFDYQEMVTLVSLTRPQNVASFKIPTFCVGERHRGDLADDYLIFVYGARKPAQLNYKFVI